MKSKRVFEGAQIGHLKVLYPHKDKKGTNGARYWKCVCVCGKETDVLVHNLSKKKYGITSCGCQMGKNAPKLEYRMAAKKQLFRCYKNSARSRNFEFNITLPDFIEITGQNCRYCGAQPNKRIWRISERPLYGDYIYNGIDRINNTKGYIMGNICPCCTKCNIAKGSMTEKEFLEHVELIYNFSVKNA